MRYVEGKKLPFSGAPKDDRNLADFHLGLYDEVVVFDHVEKVHIWSLSSKHIYQFSYTAHYESYDYKNLHLFDVYPKMYVFLLMWMNLLYSIADIKFWNSESLYNTLGGAWWIFVSGECLWRWSKTFGQSSKEISRWWPVSIIVLHFRWLLKHLTSISLSFHCQSKAKSRFCQLEYSAIRSVLEEIKHD